MSAKSPFITTTKTPGDPEDNPRNKTVSRYLDVPNSPLYPFGYGLSYTTFAYGNVQLSQTNLTGDATLLASIDVTNTGQRAGEETVQLYLSQPVASVARSVEDLKGFQKVFLQPGETRKVTFRITHGRFEILQRRTGIRSGTREFIIRIGGNSSQLKSAAVQWNR